MTTDTQSELAQELRDWARGMTTLQAATEMLIRGGYAGEGRRWIQYDEDTRRHWIDFASIPDLIGALSGGERRFLSIATSLAADEPIVLGDEVAGLDHRHANLVLAAIAAAAGFDKPTRTIVFVGDEPQRAIAPALYDWPTE